MTMTVKLDTQPERALRSRCVSQGRSASAITRDALHCYLAQTAAPVPLAYELGKELVGRYGGPANLASERKAALADVWDAKRPVQTAKASRGKA